LATGPRSPADLQPAKVLVAGDVHGYASAVDYLTHVAVTEECPVICQLGDFGYWPHQHDGARFLEASERLSSQRDIVIVFIDGNHENFDHLRRLKRSPDGFAPVSDHLFYAPRGLRWTWRDVVFLAVGGGSSVDKEWRLQLERARRKPHQRQRWFWWPEEVLTDDDVVSATSGGRVDVLLCHDCPEGVDLQDLLDPAYRSHPETLENRHRLRQVVEATLPRAIFHGHYHVAHARPYVGANGLRIACTGLNMQGSLAESWRTLDLDTFRHLDPRHSAGSGSGG
jgi:hypothetical protein